MLTHLDGIAGADARLGAPFPLPERPLPLVRWVAVHAVGERGAEVEWNVDDTRAGTPGRLVLYAGDVPPPPHPSLSAGEEWEVLVGPHRARVRTAPLPEAEPSLRPVVVITWNDGTRYLRLTAQGPWPLDELRAIGASVPARPSDPPV